MPKIERNLEVWNSTYNWSEDGEEWSVSWGNSEAQWYGSIFPRIHRFLPCQTILEIAPGYGRWTNYLKQYCTNLIAVDLSENCIQACRHRFRSDQHITYHVNDGKSLKMIDSDSIDFIFSFDSLVHAEAESLETYLNQIPDKLKKTGVGFIHHSNIGMYERYFRSVNAIPGRIRSRLVSRNIIDNTGWRASSMTAKKFEQFCEDAGLRCLSQELINWGSSRLIDCLSTFTSNTSPLSKPNQVIHNGAFMREAELIKKLSSLYTSTHA